MIKAQFSQMFMNDTLYGEAENSEKHERNFFFFSLILLVGRLHFYCIVHHKWGEINQLVFSKIS